MTRFFLAAALLVALCATATAQGPPPRPGGPPAPGGYSPYLNLLRSGNSAGVNYYGLVRPQQYFQNSIQGLQATGGSPASSPILGGQANGSDLPGTGIPVQFMNHRSFFLNLGGGGGGGAGFGTLSGAGSAGRGSAPRGR